MTSFLLAVLVLLALGCGLSEPVSIQDDDSGDDNSGKPESTEGHRWTA